MVSSSPLPLTTTGSGGSRSCLAFFLAVPVAGATASLAVFLLSGFNALFHTHQRSLTLEVSDQGRTGLHAREILCAVDFKLVALDAPKDWKSRALNHMLTTNLHDVESQPVPTDLPARKIGEYEKAGQPRVLVGQGRRIRIGGSKGRRC